jgi:hypothetical protein
MEQPVEENFGRDPRRSARVFRGGKRDRVGAPGNAGACSTSAMLVAGRFASLDAEDEADVAKCAHCALRCCFAGGTGFNDTDARTNRSTNERRAAKSRSFAYSDLSQYLTTCCWCSFFEIGARSSLAGK